MDVEKKESPQQSEQKQNNVWIGINAIAIKFIIFTIFPNLDYIFGSFYSLSFIVFNLVVLTVMLFVVSFMTYFFKSFKYICLGFCIGFIVCKLLPYGGFSGGYKSVYYGRNNSVLTPTLRFLFEDLEQNIAANEPIQPRSTRENKILEACNYTEQDVRDFALNHTSHLFNKETENKVYNMMDTLKTYDEKINTYKEYLDIIDRDRTVSYYGFYSDYRESYNSEQTKKYRQFISDLQDEKANYSIKLDNTIKAYNLYVERPYKTLIQCFSIFKYVNERWDYVSDTKGQEYFAKANESINTLKGDSDDYAILLASCMQAIGGEARIVLTHNHAFPELKINKDEWDSGCFLILFFLNKELKEKSIHYHERENEIWLNMDMGYYPGTKFGDSTKIVSIINLKDKQKNKTN